jgi:phosphoribosylaminoimidazole-succinocarboxamide synthase
MKTYEGSSKNVHVADDNKSAVFEFTDKYSVFDWGGMPDTLENKGVALALMGKIFFELLTKKGISNHYQGLEAAAQGLSNRMKVEAVAVHWPPKTDKGFDYSFYQTKPTNSLVPLEVIFRWGAPAGSSLLKRYPHVKENERFNKPIIEFTTKLEDEDRMLTSDEALIVAGITVTELNRLKELTTEVATHLKEVLSLMHVELWDGKLEWAFDEKRNFKLVDAIGLDELRVSFQNRPLSKEFLRHHYRKTHWYTKLNEAKDLAAKENGDFKEICLKRFNSAPEPLPVQVKLAAETLYTSFANDLARVFIGTTPFGANISLAHWVREF